MIDLHLGAIKDKFRNSLREYIEDQMAEQMLSVMEVVKQFTSQLEVSLRIKDLRPNFDRAWTRE